MYHLSTGKHSPFSIFSLNLSLDKRLNVPSFWTIVGFTPCNVIVHIGTGLVIFGIFFAVIRTVPLGLCTTFKPLFLSIVVPFSLFFTIESDQTTSLFYTLWATFIIFTSPIGSQHSASALTHGISPFMNVFSKILSDKRGKGATSLSKRFIYFSTVDSCSISRNWLHIVPCRGDQNRCKRHIFNAFQSENGSRSSFARY